MLYLKAVAAAAVAGATAIVTALDDNTITNVEWLTAGLAIAGSSGVVWYVVNGPGGQYAKSFFAGLTAGFTALIVAMQDNAISSQELVTTGVAVAVGLGLVAALPNTNPT